MKSVTIIGSGLAGTLVSLYLARRGYEVEVFEARPDIRIEKPDRGRSINLALSCRGITGLAGVDLMPEVEKIMVPMRARAIHEADGEIKFQAFGRRSSEYINAIHRSELNALLLNAAEKNRRIRVHFDMKLVNLDINNRALTFSNKNQQPINKSYEVLIGADGAGSYVREALIKRNLVQASRRFLPHGYKELSISRSHSSEFVPEHLHLWPRDSFMLLGNPNRDLSITGTLFLPLQGKHSFAALDDEISIRSFFKTQFSDAYPAMPDPVGEFFNHPTGNLSTVKCSPWYVGDHCLLIGDAAHGIVPFFGQGMNSAFEDCRILNELLDSYEDNWQQVMPAFFTARKVNTDAVAEMSMDNYHEIQTDIRDEQFNLKKQLEQELMHRYPERYISKHVLVMFTNTPYATAKACGEIQQALLNKICEKARSINEIDWGKVNTLMEQYDKNLANLNSKLE
ncbi:FAD-dependent oxidoreductase [Legionella jamestowniensis]|uniref:Kynurenine 3-monooxygenase n=1 Tax=Legionella jamestowniensis TaxID=455 RepID=A0A0W0UUJ8_9GAMM|nr:NAD(P)/FAD-dependent oxidoreductase [Legionella jamestowniensis]KTD11254.1 kynurenine 3-monooxygenase [Legionella jamestowniensis]SFL69910.1 kynurenine 3-monooxygenase [Legionella jamestowniensis DSM 19215]